MVGETLAGRYRIDAALGAGGTAVVYRARDLRLERDVAIKVLLPNLARDPLIAGRFDREARAMAAASHPGIVAVYDVDRGDPATGREPFFVMELCGRGSLADTMDSAGGGLSPEILVPILSDVAGGLASLHARGVIHRDVKPHNILLCGTVAKLADFGLARAQDTTRLTAAGTGAGTLAYLAPELLGGAEPGPPADVYGLGVVAFQCLTGRLPRPSGSMVDLVDARLAPAAAVSSVAPGLGRAFDQVVGAALSTDPSRRPPPMALAAGFHRALEQWRSESHAGSLVARPVGSDAATEQVRSARRAGRRAGSGRLSLAGPLVAAGALGTLAGLVILVILQAGLRGDGGPGATAPVTPAATATASAAATESPAATPSSSASESPSASPTSAPSPTPLPSPSAPPTPAPTPIVTQPPATPIRTNPPVWDPVQAVAQLRNVRQAIENAELGFNISTTDANELRAIADDVDTGLAANDGGQSAARAAKRLDDRMQLFAATGRLQNAGEMQQSVANLRSALPPVR